MIELSWLAAHDPRPLLDYLGSRTSARKLRLFAVACARRRSRDWFTPEEWQVVERVEAHADGLGGLPDPARLESNERAIMALIRRDPVSAARLTADETAGEGTVERAIGRREQCCLLRDVIGNPFRPIAWQPKGLSAEVLKQAEAIYRTQAFDHVPALAATLRDGGCTDTAILEHCLGQEPHVRGCWVIDLLLGKR